MLFSVLGLGFLIGMQHALEADHVAAVSSIASGGRDTRSIFRHGGLWGLGHALSLFAIAGTAILLHVVIADRWSTLLELAVGIMLVALGAGVLARLRRDRVHFHAHSHGGRQHIHAHSHKGESRPHARSAHAHAHAEGLPWRALAVGLVHGMAGSAALVVLTAAALESPLLGLCYILLFGIGSMVGMALLSMAIAIPLAYSARHLTRANRALQAVIGVATTAVGVEIVVASASALAG